MPGHRAVAALLGQGFAQFSDISVPSARRHEGIFPKQKDFGVKSGRFGADGRSVAFVVSEHFQDGNGFFGVAFAIQIRPGEFEAERAAFFGAGCALKFAFQRSQNGVIIAFCEALPAQAQICLMALGEERLRFAAVGFDLGDIVFDKSFVQFAQSAKDFGRGGRIQVIGSDIEAFGVSLDDGASLSNPPRRRSIAFAAAAAARHFQNFSFPIHLRNSVFRRAARAAAPSQPAAVSGNACASEDPMRRRFDPCLGAACLNHLVIFVIFLRLAAHPLSFFDILRICGVSCAVHAVGTDATHLNKQIKNTRPSRAKSPTQRNR